MKSKNPHMQRQIEAICRKVQEKVKNVEGHPFGHAYLWGQVTVNFKNGKPKTYRVCLGGICAKDLNAACRLAETVPGVSSVTYNLD